MMTKFEETISHYLDGTLSEEQEAELHHLMSVSPEARTLFREQMRLHQLAQNEKVLLPVEPALRESLFSRLAAEGMSVDAMPIAPPEPTVVSARETSGGVTDTPAGISAALARPDIPATPDQRSPIEADRREQEQKRRRRLVPFLIPLLALAISSGFLIATDNWPFGAGNGDGEILASTEVRSDVAEEAPSDPTLPSAAVGTTDRDAVPPTTTDDTPTANAADGREPMRAVAPIVEEETEERERRPSREVSDSPDFLSSPSSRPSNDEPVMALGAAAPEAIEEIDGDGSDVEITPARSSANSVGDVTPLTAEDILQGNSDSRLAEVARTTSADGQLRIRQGRGTSSTIRRDGLELGEESPEENALASENSDMDDDHLSVAAPPSRKENAAISFYDENGNPVVPTLETMESFLQALRERGIDIRPDNTFSFSPAGHSTTGLGPADVIHAAGHRSTPRTALGYQENEEIAHGGRASSRISSADDLAGTTARQSTIADDTDDNARRESAPISIRTADLEAEKGTFFLALSGILAAPVTTSVNPMPAVGIIDQPTPGTSLQGDVALKGGLRFGENRANRVFLVTGLAGYVDQMAATNNLSAAPFTPVSYEQSNRLEVWGGVGYRRDLAITDAISSGLEVHAGVGQVRYHAGVALPVTISASDRVAIEAGPNLRYRRAHRALEQTATGGDSDRYEGPANKEEVVLGAGIELILLLD